MDWFNYVVAKDHGFHSRRIAREAGQIRKQTYLGVVNVVKFDLEVRPQTDRDIP